jgi:hypothetical protein
MAYGTGTVRSSRCKKQMVSSITGKQCNGRLGRMASSRVNGPRPCVPVSLTPRCRGNAKYLKSRGGTTQVRPVARPRGQFLPCVVSAALGGRISGGTHEFPGCLVGRASRQHSIGKKSIGALLHSPLHSTCRTAGNATSGEFSRARPVAPAFANASARCGTMLTNYNPTL